MLDNRVELVVQIARAHQTMLDTQEEAAAAEVSTQHNTGFSVDGARMPPAGAVAGLRAPGPRYGGRDVVGS